jgi:hypothetical protein
LIDVGGQGDRIEARPLLLQAPHRLAVHVGAGLHALERRPRRVIAPTDARADPRPLEQLHRWEKEILQEAQVGVERVDRGQRRVGVVSNVPEQLPHVRPVLLLDVGVVVLLVRPAARELDVPARAVRPEMVVDEFRAVVPSECEVKAGQVLL